MSAHYLVPADPDRAAAVQALPAPLTTEPTFTVGQRVVVPGVPWHPYDSLREGGPGTITTELSAKGLHWVRLDSGGHFPYLPAELKPEPTI